MKMTCHGTFSPSSRATVQKHRFLDKRELSTIFKGAVFFFCWHVFPLVFQNPPTNLLRRYQGSSDDIFSVSVFGRL